MALRKLLADPYTRSELRRTGLEELSRNLWLGNCLTCGNELGDEPPAVLVIDDTVSVTATLHHATCRRPQWTRQDPGFLGRDLTARVALLAVPFGDAARDPFRPTLVVNPSLEQVTLAAGPDGRYRATTVASYRPLGLNPPSEGLVRSTRADVTAWVTDDGVVIVRCDHLYWRLALAPEEPLLDDIRNCGELVFGVSTALNPVEMVNPEPLKRVLRADDIAVAIVPLCTTEPAPDLVGHTIMVDSDLAAADEARDADWLPISYYPGASYDPSNGRFVMGTSMDGPSYWRLNTPGVGVENGLLAGPPDIGKTNSLRVIALEALQSGVFHYAVADPLDRNQLADAVGPAAFALARTRDGTVQLLRALAAAIDGRASDAQRYRDPSRETPGLLLLVDDGQEVFRDPAAAALAEKIATTGPPLGVGLVVTTTSVDLADFGNRPQLLRALSGTNGVGFTMDLFHQLRRFHDEQGSSA